MSGEAWVLLLIMAVFGAAVPLSYLVDPAVVATARTAVDRWALGPPLEESLQRAGRHRDLEADRGSRPKAFAIGVAIQLVPLAVFCLLCGAAVVLDAATWSRALALVGSLAYAPFATVGVPYVGYWVLKGRLEEARLSRRLAGACAVGAAATAFVGLLLLAWVVVVISSVRGA